MTILWCAEFLGDYKFPYPSSSGTIAYNVISRLPDRKINVAVADPHSSRHRSFITRSGKALGKLYASYNNRDVTDIVSRLKPDKIVTDDVLVANVLLTIPNCPEIVLIVRDHEHPKIMAEVMTLVAVSKTMKDALDKQGIGSSYIPLGIDFELNGFEEL